MANELHALAEAIYTDDGTRKPAHYLAIYESYFGARRNQPFDLLELGVFSGASVRVWREYFPNANIVGLDISPPPETIKPYITDGRLKHVQGDQSAVADLEKCLALSRTGQFDVIIDDASHVGNLSRLSFEFLFHHMPSGGLYFVEDYGTGYIPDFPDGGPFTETDRSDPKTFPSHAKGMVGWMKQLIDVMHWKAINPESAIFYPIASINFWPSIALITHE